MTQALREYKKIEYKLDQVTPINKYELNAYNVPFAGNTSMCREIFVKGGAKAGVFNRWRHEFPSDHAETGI